MPELTTGLIENTAVSGARPTASLVIRITNAGAAAATVQLRGYFVDGATKTQYADETLPLSPADTSLRLYDAQFDALEFRFTTSSDVIVITVWGRDAAGNLVTAHRVLRAELDSTT